MSQKFPKVRFNRFARIHGGGTPQSNPSYWGGSIPFATPKDLRPVDGKKLLKTERTLTVEGARRGSSIAQPGDVLLSVRAPVGYSVLVETEVAFSQGCKALSLDKSKAFAPFIVYAINAFKSTLESAANGTTFQELSSRGIAESSIPLPDFVTQQQIVQYLDKETAKIDRLIAKQQKLLSLTQEQAEANVEAAIWGQSIVWEKDDNIAKHSYQPRSVLYLAVADRLSSIPESWDVQRFKRIFSRKDDRNIDLSLEMLSLRQTGAVVPRSETNQNQEPSEKSLPKYLAVSPDDLVVNPMWLTGGAIGVSGLSGAVSPDYRVFTVGTELIPAYAHEILRSTSYRRQFKLFERANTTFDRRIQQIDLDNLPVPVPPVEHQKEIVRMVTQIHSHTQKLYEASERSIKLLQERRSALITAAVTGQIEV